MSSTELEVKLEIGTDAVRRLREKSALRKMTIGKPVQRELRSIYFDTPDHSLRSERASLRLRWDGRGWIQTLKYGTGLKNGLASPQEIEGPVDKPQLDLERIKDPKVGPWLKKLAAKATLAPVFETDINRDIHMLKCSDIGTAELAIDKGKVRSGKKSEGINEVEIELKSGLAHTLLTISEKLFEGECVSPSGASKAERGYALLGKRKPAPTASGAFALHRPELRADMSVEQAFKAIGGSAAEQILGNWRILHALDDSEVPHQFRIGLRRLRTSLRIFADVAADKDLKRLSKAARNLGRVVGHLRNADVLVQDIAEPAIAALGKDKCHEALLDFLAEARIGERQNVRALVAGKDWTRLKLNCMLFDQAVERALHRAPDRIATRKFQAVASEALENTWQEVRDRGRGFADHKISERHEMRKTLKTMRYATDYLMPIYPGADAKDFLRRLRGLQNVFGYLNDVAMADELSARIAADHPDRSDLNKSVRLICDWHAGRAKKQMRKADDRWRELRKSKKFWR
ncbi:CYTH and CHAD domain-containing protein [Hoeflea poritis]|uniref:CHAD domain-containing protein n=1 Tax=Hoeflea poritis TaxID=2993659 RepID=A0ABT4VW77_9HYPH|nr:CYTH and CHAD domain-containing protein [Hoeflea poritis]MDA4848460.1 CHAD domain-containing protein [Hoeflea poritis]